MKFALTAILALSLSACAVDPFTGEVYGPWPTREQVAKQQQKPVAKEPAKINRK